MIFLFDLLRDCMKCQILLLDQTQVSSVRMTHVSNIESLESISREANSNYNNNDENNTQDWVRLYTLKCINTIQLKY